MTHETRSPLAIIAGGTGFIGKAIACLLRDNGWRVITLSRKGGGEHDIKCDITDALSVQEALRTLVDSYGTIDACIHCAAVKIDTKDTSGTQTSVALQGAMNLANAALPHMPVGSPFIAITTKLAEPGVKSMQTGDYVTAKIALREYLRKLAKESDKNIRVYAVAPGLIAGGLNEGLPNKFLEMLAKKTGTGTATAEQVARLVVTLCSETNAFPPSSSITVPEEAVSAL